MVVLVLIVNFLEVIGLSLFVPIIDLFQGKGTMTRGITRILSAFIAQIGLPPVLATFLILLCLLFLFKSSLAIWLRYLSVRVAADLQDRLRNQFFRSLLLSTTKFVGGQRQGTLLSVLNEHTVRTGQSLFILIQIVAQIVTAIAYTIFVFWISWKLTAVALFLGLLAGPAIRHVGRVAHRHGKDYTQALETVQHTAVEGLNAKKLVNAMNWAPPLLGMFARNSRDVRDHWQWMAFWSNSLGILVQPISVIILSLIIWLAVRFGLSASLLGAFALAFTRLLPVVQGTASMMADFQASSPSINRVLSMLEEAEGSKEPSGTRMFDSLRNSIKIEDLFYRYGDREPIFEGLDLEIEKGKTTALVGPSGAGKTTLVDLILGLLRPEGGRVLIDQMDLSDLDLKLFRAHIAYVPQEPVLFHDSIRNNLTIGLEHGVDDEDLKLVCEKAGAWEFVSRRIGGLDSVIGDKGTHLSGGQRQRLALARALLRKPEILILDEATSALDNESEHVITKTLGELQTSGQFTIIVIAHRYATIQNADQIYEIAGGKATPLGNWDSAQSYLVREAGSLAIT